MANGYSRRRLVAAFGVASTATVAGCLNAIFGDETAESGDDETNTEDGIVGEVPGDGEWPAIDAGDVISDFESADRWEPVSGEIEPVPEEARIGSQALAVESETEKAAARISFSDGLDLEGWDTSMAVKMESATRIHVEFMAPERGDHLTSICHVPADYDGWLRLDFGYIQKHGEPDLSNVRRLNIIAIGPDDGPTRFVADDLRRTGAVDNGKAILSLYGGFDSHFDIAAPTLEERGWGAAVPVDSAHIGSQGRMDASELRQLRDRGWDVCSYPRVDDPLPEQPEDRQRQIVEATKSELEELGFSDGARHFFVPDDRMDRTTHDIVREHHDSGFLLGGSPSGAPPTGIHMTSQIWGPDLHGGVRRAINLCDQYQQLTALRIPRIVEDEDAVDANSMSVENFENLLDHIEHRGLDVVTPSDLIDGTMDDEVRANAGPTLEEGTILEAGESHSFDGTGTTESDEFDLVEGVLTTNFSHEESTFDVELVSVDGDGREDRLVTTSEPTTAESMITVDEGRYRVAVDGSGAWSIDLEQPAVHSDDLADLPAYTSGSGSSFVGPLWTAGDVTLDVTHDGDGEFLVDGYGVDGHREQLINRTGAFDGSRSYSAGGAVWITVEADGDWTLEINGE